MTSTIVSLAMIFSPVAPVPSAGSEAVQPAAVAFPAAGLNPHMEDLWLSADALTADIKPATSYFDYSTSPVAEVMDLSAATVLPVVNDSPASSPPTLPEQAPIEVGMNRLAELGATGWQLRTFGCLAWYESKNNPYAVSPTNDHGLWQINRYYHAWRWRGRDIYDPTTNAEIAWDIYRESGFRAWTTARLCGVS